jgi:thiamine biosynthesis lipoprotein
MDRRDFLHPRRLAQAAGHALAAFDALEPPPPSVNLGESETAILRLSYRAMATTFEMVVPFGAQRAQELAGEAFDLLDDLEAQLTVYRDSSEVSRLNRVAAQQAVEVEQGLFGLLLLAQQLNAETAGAFDVTAGALIKAWGFFRGPKRVPTPDALAAAMAAVGMRWIRLDAERRSVRYLRSGLEINLGAIGKGYALDRLGEFLRTEGNLSSVLLQGGHSSVYAIGSPDGEPRGWPIDLRHPWLPDQRLARVWLRDRALGTSAATFQHLEYNGRKLGHVLDPRTGWPAAGVASASVLAPTAARADALSTAFFVGGVELARQYCQAHTEVGAVLLPEGADAVPLLLGLSPSEVNLCPDPPSAGTTDP